ncbi:hypothetical protein SMALB_0105 [Streptomyces malaysiensis]|uniref:Uncharacterized protein n=1 Tax=Streptomyces malaysiensis TaxID=92644 RepID=A0A7X5WWE9_STRMQ|nr:hypothetical protein [Streptomyces malaysiensis]
MTMPDYGTRRRGAGHTPSGRRLCAARRPTPPRGSRTLLPRCGAGARPGCACKRRAGSGCRARQMAEHRRFAQGRAGEVPGPVKATDHLTCRVQPGYGITEYVDHPKPIVHGHSAVRRGQPGGAAETVERRSIDRAVPDALGAGRTAEVQVGASPDLLVVAPYGRLSRGSGSTPIRSASS